MLSNLFLLFLNMVISCLCWFLLFSNNFLNCAASDEDPLILTDLIKNGKIEEARQLSIVNSSILQNVLSYSGFLTVNESFNSNLFFWFFTSENSSSNSPVVLWLNGGPGTSSLYGLFTENGPFELTNDFNVTLRNSSWSKCSNLLYIDNPVGTGFSFTDPQGYLKDEDEIGEQLYTALDQFFDLFVELRDNEFFVAGESYGGKYIPAVAYKILQKNLNRKKQINLRGIAIGNGWIDPRNQLNYGEYLYQTGFLDLKGKTKMEKLKVSCQKAIDKENYIKAVISYASMIKLFLKSTGYTNLYNYLQPKDSTYGPMENFLHRKEIKRLIHAGNTSFKNGKTVFLNLLTDFMASSKDYLREILNNIPVLLYSGQVDVIVNYPSTLNFLSQFNFSSAEEYKTSSENIWKINQEIAGYVKVAGNLTVLLVRNAGHMVPTDQPKWAYDLIYRFTHHERFF